MKVDAGLLKEFEEKLNPTKPEESEIPVRILGYGEISTLFEILHEGQEDIAYKRMPLFDTMEQVERYVDVYERYHEYLREVGIEVPEYGSTVVETDNGRIVLYLYQRKLPRDAIGNNVIHSVSEEGVRTLVKAVLGKLERVWDFNQRRSPEKELAIDGQISNWAVKDYSGGELEGERIGLFYLDTSTPLFRENGVEQLDVELFLKPTPPIIRWYLKKYYLQEIVDRYYDFRKVIVDLIANFLKEQKGELVPKLLEMVNEYLSTEGARFDIEPLTKEEIDEYYEDDASTWELYLKVRRAHRFIKTRILRGYYAYILPADIQR